jgi:hypothetical protein
MTESTFCPYCFRKNDPDAGRCAFCQTPLQPRYSNIRTTVRVSEQVTDSKLSAPCLEQHPSIPPGGFALLIMSRLEPILVEPGPAHILGRFGAEADEAETRVIDLSDYGAAELGVSRRHAEIRGTEAGCVLQDLGSTNGTWLNQRRLAPGVAHILHNNDQIILGRLALWVCLGEEEAVTRQPARVSLHPPAALPGFQAAGISPEALQAMVLPYLEKLAEVQGVLDGCRQQPSETLLLGALETTEETAVVTLEVFGIGDAVSALRPHLTVWRERHPDLVGAKAEEIGFLLEPDMRQLAAALLADYTLGLSQEQRENAVAALRPWLEQIAIHPLTIL